MSDEAERIQAAEQAALVLRLTDQAFTSAEKDFSERIAKIAVERPWDATKISALAMALEATRLAKSHLQGKVADGKIAQAQIDHLRKIEGLSPQRRRFL